MSIHSEKPYPSWTWVENEIGIGYWDAPVVMPTDGKTYYWDEPSLSWKEVQ